MREKMREKLENVANNNISRWKIFVPLLLLPSICLSDHVSSFSFFRN